MKMRLLFVFAVLVCGMLVVACNPETVSEPTTPAAVDVPVETATEMLVEKPTETLPPPEATPSEEVLPTKEIFPPDGQMIEFASTDGTMLSGVYFPPETGPAPVVVLMHQYPLDHETQWFAIAPWLQNRGLAESVISGEMPWGDPSWFPAVPKGLNVGVFAFTFRGCKGGCQNAGLSRAEGAIWAEDARAALLKVATLPGADAEQIIAVGTSIGADGVVDGCWLAEEDGLHCAGAMSWSPGSYLLMQYAETVEQLTAAGVPVGCFAAELDGQSADTCRSYSGEGYAVEIDPGGSHGIALVDPDLEIDTLNLLLEFLEQTVGE
jgi:hypothetical protein